MPPPAIGGIIGGMNPLPPVVLDDPPGAGPRASDGPGSLPAKPIVDDDSRPVDGFAPAEVPPDGVKVDGVNVEGVKPDGLKLDGEAGVDELSVLGVDRCGVVKLGVVVSSVDGTLLDSAGSGNGIELDGSEPVGSGVENDDGVEVSDDGADDVSEPGTSVLGGAPPGVSAPGVVPPGV